MAGIMGVTGVELLPLGKLAISASLLLIGYLVGKLSSSFIKATVDLMGLDKWLRMKGFVEVEGVTVSRLLSFLMRWFSYLLFLNLALSLWMDLSLMDLFMIYGRVSALLVSLYLSLSFIYSLRERFKEGPLRALIYSLSNLSSVALVWVLVSVLLLGIDTATVLNVTFYLIVSFLIPFSAIFGAYTAIKVFRKG